MNYIYHLTYKCKSVIDQSVSPKWLSFVSFFYARIRKPHEMESVKTNWTSPVLWLFYLN